MLSATFLLSTSIVLGQAAPDSTAEREAVQAAVDTNPLEEFGKAFIGTWKSEWTAETDHDEGKWRVTSCQ
jgi:hypothetical protein